MISCETPNQRLNYVFSCHLLAQVQIKIGKLEGERTKPTYKQLLETPHLNYSGALQHLDLYVSAQIFSNNQALCMPVKTSYRYIEKQPWVWDEWLTLPLKISDLPRNSQLAITAWDIESPQSGDVPVCAACISLFDKFGEFRQGVFEIRMWPNRVADGSTRTTTPGIVSDVKELELEEHNGVLLPASSEEQTGQQSNNNTGSSLHHSASAPVVDEFPILDELDRLAKMSKYHYDGHMIKQDWLDRLTLKEIQNATKKEKFNSKFFFMAIEFAQIKCEDVKYKVLYYEENAERIIQTIPTNELFVVNDPELDLDNIIELKNRKLMHSKQMGILDMYLKPDTESKNLLHKIVNYPVTRPIKGEEQALLWKYRYYLTQNKKALTKFLQCFDLNLEFEGNALMELMLKWQPMDIEDALELLGSKYKNYPKIRSYAISRLRLASNKDLILYLLQLVQALRYENFNQTDQQNMPTIQSITTSNGSSLTGSSSNGSSRTASTTTSATKVNQKRPSGSKSSESGAAKNSSSSNNLLGKAKSSSTSLSKMKDDDENNREEAYEDEDVMESEAGAASAAEGDEQEEAEDENDEKSKQFENFKYSSSPPATLAAATSADLIANHRTANLLHEAESISKKAFDSNLKSFLLQRACQNEIVALNLYWFVKVEIKDTKILSNSSSNAAISQQQQQQAQIAQQSAASSGGGSTSNLLATAGQSGAGGDSYANQQGSNAAAASSTANASNANDQSSKTNFQIFMDELIDSLRNGDSYARSIYENIISQEKFLKSLNDVVRATSRESGTRDKKVIKLRTFLNDTGKSSSSSFDLVDFDHPIPLIIDPSVRIIGINVDKTTMFKSNLMPCKFVFKTLPDLNTIDMDRALEYSTIYKIGDDLRQDQLVLQMIALMDKLLKQENLDLKLTPYKVVATGIKEGFLQFVDALAISNILANSEFRTIKEYLKKNNPSDTDKHGISAEAMDNYVRSCAGYMVITYILGVGDRHYDNILITKCGKILHVDFGYILGRDPKPFQPVIKWTKDMADGMGGRYGPDGKETKEYEDFKKYCCNAFLHLRRHANLILNLFSLMVDANIPDIALEPDKTVKKLIERFKLDVADEQAQYLLIREIESNYDSIVGNITDIIHTYSTAQK